MIKPDSSRQADLTREKFEGLLMRLDDDRGRAGEKYEQIRWKLLRFFQWGRCLDAEDLVDETFNRVAEKLVSQSQDIRDVAGFAWGVAKKIRQEALRIEAKTVRLPDLPGGEDSFFDNNVADNAPFELAVRQQRLKCLRQCIQLLSAEDRRLLLTYHSPRGRRPEARRRLAKENEMSMLALRVRANRLRFKLEECIKKRLSSTAD
jgi:DNA-directed RNA polymerase specialized sigma24 family protein